MKTAANRSDSIAYSMMLGSIMIGYPLTLKFGSVYGD